MPAKIPTPTEPELPSRRRKRSPHATRPEGAPASPGPDTPTRSGRTLTVRLEKERIDALKAVIDNIGPKIGQRTMTDLVQTAVDKHLADLHKEHNGGQPFPQYH
ncbi:MAG: hypothetical protein DI630_13275 [Gordonia sp. (in: high G+C Gram-positive bacteria)]|nr:MAG: hypothetical protein DI630_13275 [Gordonia sp. (in: high G+C Gram-positive bacteria)]